MSEKPNAITVADALKRAYRHIVVPAKLMMPMLLLCSGIPFLVDRYHSNASGIIGTSCLAGCFIIPIFYSLIATTKWRIWAFGKVNDVHLLREIAEQEDIIPRRGSWLWKLSIETKRDKEQLTEINKRFAIQQESPDDPGVPVTLDLHNYHVYVNLIIWAIMGVMLYFIARLNAFPTMKFLANDNVQMAILLIPLGLVVVAIYHWVNRNNAAAAVTLSNTGIENRKDGYKTWAEIRNERVEITYESHYGSHGAGATKKRWLVYDHDNGTARADLGIPNVPSWRVRYLLKVYRRRFEHSSAQKIEKLPDQGCELITL